MSAETVIAETVSARCHAWQRGCPVTAKAWLFVWMTLGGLHPLATNAQSHDPANDPANDLTNEAADEAKDEAAEITRQQTQPLAKANSAEDPIQRTYHSELIRGRVVWLADALKTNYGISTVPEVAEHGLVLLTKDGSLLPLVENLRGRAFRKDPRLREMDLEILVRRYQQQPFVQVVKIFEIDGDQRFEIDYWCDVCAILMFESGPCSCCQDQNRLRKRPVQRADLEQQQVEPQKSAKK